MGFLLSSLGLLVLFITIKIFGLVLLSPLLTPTLSSTKPHLACMPSLPILLCSITLISDADTIIVPSYQKSSSEGLERSRGIRTYA